MKVLFVPPMSYPLHMGGFESQVLHIYNDLLNNGVDVQWYNLISTDINNFDIIHFHSSVSEFVPVAMKAKDLGKKIIITPMVGSPRYSNLSYKMKIAASKLPGCFYVMKKFTQLFSMADHFITLTSFEKNRLKNVFNIDKEISIIPNGIDDFYLGDESIDVELPFDKYVIVVGRIEPDKNQLPLIEIANELKFNLLIVGEPGSGHKDYYDTCKNISGNNVFFWGKESNPKIMRSLYKKALLTAIPSITEMLPLVIFESLSQQTPVLCTTQCGLYPEPVDGVFYTKPIKSELYNNIVKLLPNLNSIKFSKKHIFSWNDIAKQHIEIYNRIIF